MEKYYLNNKIDYNNYNLDEYVHQNNIRQEIGKNDRILSDLDHKLELCHLNNEEILQVGHKRQKTLKERRELKNELYLTNQVIDYFRKNRWRFYDTPMAGQIVFSIIEENKRKIQNKIYTPLVLIEDFTYDSHNFDVTPTAIKSKTFKHNNKTKLLKRQNKDLQALDKITHLLNTIQ